MTVQCINAKKAREIADHAITETKKGKIESLIENQFKSFPGCVLTACSSGSSFCDYAVHRHQEADFRFVLAWLGYSDPFYVGNGGGGEVNLMRVYW